MRERHFAGEENSPELSGRTPTRHLFRKGHIAKAIARARRCGRENEIAIEAKRQDEKVQAALSQYEENLVEARRFSELASFLEITGRELPLDPAKAEREVQVILNDRMPVAAMHLLIACTNAGVKIDEKIEERARKEYSAELFRRNVREAREGHEDEHEIPKEAHKLACVFYVESRIVQNLENVMREVRILGMELPFATELRIRELHDKHKRLIKMVSSRLQKYLVTAVTSELRHQHFIRGADHFDDVELRDANELYASATDEELLEFFYHAKVRFQQGRWLTQHGGKPWSDISEAAIALVERPFDIPTIDHVFDLEHNTGAIFDKDGQVIVQDDDKMAALKTQKILDAKASAIGGTRSLVRILREQLPHDRQFFDKLDHEVNKWVDALHAIERIFLAHGKKFELEKYV